VFGPQAINRYKMNAQLIVNIIDKTIALTVRSELTTKKTSMKLEAKYSETQCIITQLA
jgi:hypothetical protein